MATPPGHHACQDTEEAAPTLTVIVPTVFDGPHTLRALDGLVDGCNNYSGRVELVVVDDSLDGSNKFDAMADESPYVTLIHTGGGQGPGVARNLGLRAARGTFVAFVDDDDVVLVEGILGAIDSVPAASIDVIGLTFVLCFESGRSRLVRSAKHLSVAMSRWAGIWRFCYRRSWLAKHWITFPPIRYGEDVVFLSRVLEHQPRYCSLDKLVYVHSIHAPRLSTPDHKEHAAEGLGCIGSQARAARHIPTKALLIAWWLRAFSQVYGRPMAPPRRDALK